MNKPFKLLLMIMICILSFNSVFAEDKEKWGYSKDINYDNQGEIKAIYLDEDIYRYANDDLSDLRIIDNKDKWIPYYLYNSWIITEIRDYTEYNSEEILSYTKDNNYYVDYKIFNIQDNQDILGNKLSFSISKDRFYKEIEVLGSYDNKNWESIKKDTIYNIEDKEKTEVFLEDDYKFNYYRIVSLNDTTKIPISNLNLIYDNEETIYKDYQRTKTIDYKIESNNKNKETIIKIHNKDRLKINNIEIKSSSDFNRDYRLISVDSKGEAKENITSGTIYRFNMDTLKAQDTNIPIRELNNSEYLEIIIDNRDNEAINIEKIYINYNIDKLVFNTSTNEDIKLLFGNKEAVKPDYDVEIYKEEMEKMEQEVATLSNLQEREIEKEEEKFKFNEKWILNTIVIIIAGLLAIIILKNR